MTNNTSIRTAAWVEVGPLMLHSTGASVESKKINTAGDRAWVVVLPDCTMLTNQHTGRVQGYKTPDAAMKVYEAFLRLTEGK